MKKTFYFLLLTIVALYSCSNDNDINSLDIPNTSIGFPKKIYMKIDNDPEFYYMNICIMEIN